MQPQPFATGFPDFRPIGSLTNWVIFCFIAVIFADVVSVIASFSEIELANGIIDGMLVTEEQAMAHDSRMALFGILTVAVSLLNIILFIRWFRRAYHNAAELSAEPTRFHPSWAIKAWFVPILNLVRPYQIAEDIWKRSVTRPTTAGIALAAPSSGTGIITAWWLLFIVAGAVSQVALRLSLRAETPEQVIRADWALIIADAASIIAALVAISFVRELTSRQERAMRLANQAMPFAPMFR